LQTQYDIAQPTGCLTDEPIYFNRKRSSGWRDPISAGTICKHK
jgi:hypothetical protein